MQHIFQLSQWSIRRHIFITRIRVGRNINIIIEENRKWNFERRVKAVEKRRRWEREREASRKSERAWKLASSTPEIILLVLYARFSIVLSGRHERRCKNSPTFFASSSYHHLQPRRCRYSFPTLPTGGTDMPPTHLYPNLLPPSLVLQRAHTLP